MIKKLKLYFIVLSSSAALLLPALAVQPAQAAFFDTAKTEACKGVTLDDKPCDDVAANNTVNRVLSTALKLLSLIVGIASILMLILSGLRLVTSQGDSSTVSSARQSAMYAIIGLVIVALAQIIVRYVLTQV